MTTTPALPKAAQELLDLAERYGWDSLAQWGTRSNDVPFLTVQVGRRSDKTVYRFVWYSNGTPGLRLQSKGVESDHYIYRHLESMRVARDHIITGLCPCWKHREGILRQGFSK